MLRFRSCGELKSNVIKPTAIAKTDPGLKRKDNQDYALIDAGLALYVVCDGMGGHAHGQVASELAATVVRDALAQSLQKSSGTQSHAPVEMLRRCVEQANERVHQESEAMPGASGMGTTLSALWIRGQRAFIAHVGDSRIYLIREAKPHQLTADHKFGAEMVRKGEWSAETAKRSPYSHVLSRAIGPAPVVQVDTFELELSPGDRFLLCSDGLGDYLTPDILTAQAERKASADKLADELVALAKAGGGHDNITTVVVDVDEPESQGARVGAVAPSPARPTVRPAAGAAQPITSAFKAEVLSKIPLFKFLTYAEIIKFLNVATTRAVTGGTYLIGGTDAAQISAQAQAQEMFVVVQGEVTILKGEQVVAHKREGELVGEMILLDGAPRSAEVRADKPTTLLVFSRAKVLQVLRSDPMLATKLLWSMNLILVQRLRNTTEDLVTARANLRALGSGDLPFIVPQ